MKILEGIKGHVQSVWAAAEPLIWPVRCAVCHGSMSVDEKPVCRTCWNELSFTVSHHYCRRCGRSVSPYGLMPEGCGHCQDQSFQFDRIVRAGLYESAFRRLILNMKFRDCTELTGVLGTMLNDAFTASGLAEKTDVFVPVPLHWRRRLERGFNQSLLLTKHLKLHSIPVSEDLVRIRYTTRQWNLSGPERRRNVKNAFRVRKDHVFYQKRICLVDDITTSGATLNECAQTLKKAGASEVFALVLTVAEQGI